MADPRLVVWLGMNNDPLLKGFAGASRAQRSYVAEAGRTAAANKRGTFAFLELSRGIEDAAVSFETGGLTGAIRGAGNNVTAFLTMISPLAGAFGGLALAATSLLVPALSRIGSEAKDSAAELDNFKTRLDAALSANRERAEFYAGLGKAQGSSAVKGIAEGLRSQQSTIDDELRQLEQEREAKLAGARVFLPNLARPLGPGDKPRVDATDLAELQGLGPVAAEQAAKLAEIEERINQRITERETLQRRLLATERRLQEARERELAAQRAGTIHDNARLDWEEQIKASRPSALERQKADEARKRSLEEALGIATKIQERLSPWQAQRGEIQRRWQDEQAAIVQAQSRGALSPQQAQLLGMQSTRAAGQDLQQVFADLERRLDPKRASRADIDKRYQDEQAQIRAQFDEGLIDSDRARFLSTRSAEIANRERDKLDGPNRSSLRALTRGSSEALDVIARAQGNSNPNARLESLAQQQLREARLSRQAMERMRRESGSADVIGR